MKKKKIPKIILIIILFRFTISNYPEDFSTINQLTNPENKDNSKGDEVFLGSYYHSNSLTPSPKYDFRNGIIINPKSLSTSSPSTCTYVETYSGNDDDLWEYNTINLNYRKFEE